MSRARRILPPALVVTALLVGVATADAPVTRPEDRPLVSAEDAPVRRNGDGPGAWWQTIGALALVAGLILALRWVLKRTGAVRSLPRSAGGPVELVSRTPVGAKQQLTLVRLGRRLVLLGWAGESVAPLAEVTDPGEVQRLLGGRKQEQTEDEPERNE